MLLPELRVVLDEQDRERDEHESETRQVSLQRGRGIDLGQDDENHDHVAARLDPALEGDVGVVGPQHAEGGPDEEQEHRAVRAQHAGDPRSARHEHAQPHDQYRGHDKAVERAAIEERVRRLGLVVGPEPLRHHPGAGQERPGNGEPERRRHARPALAVQLEQEEDAADAGEGRDHAHRAPQAPSLPAPVTKARRRCICSR